MGSLAVSSDFVTDPEAQQLASVRPEAPSISRHVNRYLIWARRRRRSPGDGAGVAVRPAHAGPGAEAGSNGSAAGPGRPFPAGRGRRPNRDQASGSQLQHHGLELEDAERRRHSLTADIAHELRTPTSNIQGYMEAIKDGVFNPARRSSTLFTSSPSCWHGSSRTCGCWPRSTPGSFSCIGRRRTYKSCCNLAWTPCGPGP